MMKNIFTTLLFCFCFINTFNSQNNKFGLKFGLNFSELNDLEASPKVGLILGATYQYDFNNKFSIQPELVFSSQGAAKILYDGKDVVLNYLNLPIMGKYKLSFLKGLSIDAGPQFGYLLSGKNGDDKLSGLNKFDFSLALGGTYRLNNNFDIGVRGVLGITDTDVVDNFNTEAFMYNEVLQITIVYKLPLRKKADKILIEEQVNGLQIEETVKPKVPKNDVKENDEISVLENSKEELTKVQKKEEEEEEEEINNESKQETELKLLSSSNKNNLVINFDSNKYIPLDKYMPDLIRIGNQLKGDKNLKVTIDGYADSKSFAEFNMELSRLRANWIYNYFVSSMGIDKNRVFKNFYGENKLKNNCDDNTTCSDLQHKENRRVVIQIN